MGAQPMGPMGPAGPSLDQLMAAGPPVAEEESNAPQPIGGFVAPRPTIGGTVAMTGPQGAVPVDTQLAQQTAANAYYEGDERVPASFAVEDVAALQQAMSRAGLLTGKFQLGLWDKPSMSAYTELLGFANQQGTDYVTALNLWASSPQMNGTKRSGEEDAFQPGKFLPSDPAVYRNAVRLMYQQTLGRDPHIDELEEDVQRLRNRERGAFREAKDVFEASGGMMGAEDFGTVENNALEAQTARFQERFEQRARPELKFRDEQAANAADVNMLGGILGTVEEMM